MTRRKSVINPSTSCGSSVSARLPGSGQSDGIATTASAECCLAARGEPLACPQMVEHLLAGLDRKPLRVLIVEHDPMDAALIVRQLERGGFDQSWSCAANERDYLAALTPDLDVILSDFNIPQFTVDRALELLKARDLDIPLIVVSGSIGEDRGERNCARPLIRATANLCW